MGAVLNQASCRSRDGPKNAIKKRGRWNFGEVPLPSSNLFDDFQNNFISFSESWISVKVWLATDFPIDMEQFVPVTWHSIGPSIMASTSSQGVGDSGGGA